MWLPGGSGTCTQCVNDGEQLGWAPEGLSLGLWSL